MSIPLRSVCCAVVALAAAGSAQGVTVKTAYRIDATVTAAFSTGPVSSATGSFSFRFDNGFLTGLTGDQGDWPVRKFETSLNPIGGTTFSPANVEGYVYYNNLNLRQVLVGGVGPGISDENSVGGNTNDFYIWLTLKPGGQLDDSFGSPPGRIVWANSSNVIYSGVIIASASSVTLTRVPEPASGALTAALAAVAGARVAAVLRRRSR